MYIIKNALRCISRSAGRNILIGIIVTVIAVSSCLGLSINQAAESARKETLASLSVTATISFDRQSIMGQLGGGRGDLGSMEGGMGGGFMGNIGNFFGGENAYVTEISSAVNLTVVIQMLGIAVLLTLISGFASMLFVMRYEPLRILSNRD